MTIREQQTIDNLLQAIRDLRSDNLIYRENINKQVETLSKKVEQEKLPITLEHQLMQAACGAMDKAMKEALSGYNGVMQKYADAAIKPYEQQIINIFSNAIEKAITNGDFSKIAKEDLLHKIVKSIISGMDGSVDKVINNIKQDPIYRSKLILFINNLVEEFINKK